MPSIPQGGGLFSTHPQNKKNFLEKFWIFHKGGIHFSQLYTVNIWLHPTIWFEDKLNTFEVLLVL